MTAEVEPDLPGRSAGGQLADPESSSGVPSIGLEPPAQTIPASDPKPFPSPPAAIALTPILSARYR